MSDQWWGDLPTGRQLDAPSSPAGHWGSFDVLHPAMGERLALSRKHFLEASASDFTRRGKRLWVDRATGAEYRRVSSDPLAGNRIARNGIIFVIAGGKLLYLSPRGHADVESLELGSVGAREESGSRGVSTSPHGPEVY